MKTRTKIIVCVFAVALTIPLETILLKALSESNPQMAVRSYVASLSDENLQQAARDIRWLPFSYRREVMRRLNPTDRAETWRRHLQTYLDEHSSLDGAAVNAINEAIALISPAMFESPTDGLRAQEAAVATKIVALLGRDEADYLLYRLGRKDGTFASREPVMQKLASYVRNTFVAYGRIEGCDCAPSYGCEGLAYCKTSDISCTRDEDWPMCGWFWNTICSGLCYAGTPHEGG